MSYNPENPDGQATMANSSPVVIASDQSAVKVDGSAVTQPVSGTVTANVGTTNGLALDATLTGGNEKVQGNVASGSADSGNPIKVGAVFNSTPPTPSSGQRVDLQADASGNLKTNVTNTVTVSGTVTANPSGTQSTNVTQIAGNSVATAATGIQKMGLTDGTGTAITSTSNALDVNIKSGGGGGGASATDEAAWTAGSSTFAPAGGVFNDTATALTSGQEGTARMTNNRALHANIRNASGTELATSSNPLRVDPTGATTQPVSGTVTANVGTTNGLALDSSVNSLQVAQGSTTSGQSGHLVQGAVTTAAPSYTTAQTSPLSLDTSGNVRTTVNNTVTVSGTVSTNPPSNASVNINQVGGNAVATAASGIAKVGLTDGTGTAINSTSNALNVNLQNASVAVSESGTWTVQPGNTPNTTPWLVSLNPSASGGWSVSSQTALTSTIVAVKGSAGQLGGYMLYNPNASASYVQVFNNTTGGSTLGSPTYVIPLPPNGAANIEFANGITHSTAISVAATTSATGTGAPTTALTGFFLFK